MLPRRGCGMLDIESLLMQAVWNFARVSRSRLVQLELEMDRVSFVLDRIPFVGLRDYGSKSVADP